MESDHNKSSPENEGRRRSDSDSHSSNVPPMTLIEDVAVSSSFPVVPTTTDIVSSSPNSGRKRSRAQEKGESSSTGGGYKGKKKGELIDPPSSDPKCATCGKTFGSWKAVFGHLRSHPERDYRGAFPPPKVWEEMLQQQDVARQQQHGQDGQGSSAATARSSLMCGRGIEIDLNDPEEPHKDDFPFDLNMTPPEIESEEDDDKDNKES